GHAEREVNHVLTVGQGDLVVRTRAVADRRDGRPNASPRTEDLAGHFAPQELEHAVDLRREGPHERTLVAHGALHHLPVELGEAVDLALRETPGPVLAAVLAVLRILEVVADRLSRLVPDRHLVGRTRPVGTLRQET